MNDRASDAVPGLSDEASTRSALARLDELDGLPVAEHPAVFEDIHRSLQDTLSRAAEESGEPPEPDGES